MINYNNMLQMLVIMAGTFATVNSAVGGAVIVPISCVNTDREMEANQAHPQGK